MIRILAKYKLLVIPVIIYRLKIYILTHKIGFDLVSNAIKRSNLDISGGSIKTAKDEIIIRSNNRQTTTKGLEDIVVLTAKNGDILKIRDIANVSLNFSDIPIKVYVNGERAINFIIQKTPEEDIKKIANSVQKYIKQFNKDNPEFEIITLFQFADMLDQRIETLSDNLILGLLLVAIILGLFLSFRLSLWVRLVYLSLYRNDIYWSCIWNDYKYDFIIRYDIGCRNTS